MQPSRKCSDVAGKIVASGSGSYVFHLFGAFLQKREINNLVFKACMTRFLTALACSHGVSRKVMKLLGVHPCCCSELVEIAVIRHSIMACFGESISCSEQKLQMVLSFACGTQITASFVLMYKEFYLSCVIRRLVFRSRLLLKCHGNCFHLLSSLFCFGSPEVILASSPPY